MVNDDVELKNSVMIADHLLMRLGEITHLRWAGIRLGQREFRV